MRRVPSTFLHTTHSPSQLGRSRRCSARKRGSSGELVERVGERWAHQVEARWYDAERPNRTLACQRAVLGAESVWMRLCAAPSSRLSVRTATPS